MGQQRHPKNKPNPNSANHDESKPVLTRWAIPPPKRRTPITPNSIRCPKVSAAKKANAAANSPIGIGSTYPHHGPPWTEVRIPVAKRDTERKYAETCSQYFTVPSKKHITSELNRSRWSANPEFEKTEGESTPVQRLVSLQINLLARPLPSRFLLNPSAERR